MTRTFRTSRRPATLGGRRRSRPAIEALEGRSLLTAALDPTFGTGGYVLGTFDAGSTDLTQVSAVAVQGDNKTLVAGTYPRPVAGGAPTSGLAVRRYNADGSVDTTFGTNGQATVPVDAAGIGSGLAPTSIVIRPDGAIDLAASTSTTSGPGTTYGGLVAQLTAGGQLDPSFGTDGVYRVPASNVAVNSVALQGSELLVMGTTNPTDLTTPLQMVVYRLTAAGTLDAGFGSAGQATVDVPRTFAFNTASLTPAAIVVTPDGNIDVAANASYNFTSVNQSFGYVAQLNSEGVRNASYGMGGFAPLGQHVVRGAVSQPDGKVVIVGSYGYSKAPLPSFVIRLQADGTIDSSFAGRPLKGNSGPISSDDIFSSVALGPNGTILVGGLGGGHLIERYDAAGRPDPSFGIAGRMAVPAPPPIDGYSYSFVSGGFVAATPDGKVVVAGTNAPTAGGQYRSVLARVRPVAILNPATNDFDGDGSSDFAVLITANAYYGVRSAAPGSPNGVVQQFGQPGAGNTLPVAGDFDGDGRPDVAAYLPSTGSYAYRASSGGGDRLIQFGPAGPGASIPAPGNYFGVGATALAVYIPALGAFAVRGPGGVGNALVPFGAPGAGASIPAPGDYDGDGKTDLAVYLPASGVFAYRPSAGGADVLTSFGMPGDRMSIPVPGDYDGDGKTDLAVYMPSIAVHAYRRSSAGNTPSDVLQAFGVAGDGASIPAPGDYDGDGQTDVAAYLTNSGSYAYRRSSSRVANDYIPDYGDAGPGATIPVTSIPYAYATAGVVSARGVGGEGAAPAVYLPLTADVLDLIRGSADGTTARKKAGRAV